MRQRRLRAWYYRQQLERADQLEHRESDDSLFLHLPHCRCVRWAHTIPYLAAPTSVRAWAVASARTTLWQAQSVPMTASNVRGVTVHESDANPWGPFFLSGKTSARSASCLPFLCQCHRDVYYVCGPLCVQAPLAHMATRPCCRRAR